MAAVKILSPKDFKCRNYRTHWLERVDERKLVLPMALELDAWLKAGQFAPDLEEAPDGWRKQFPNVTGGWAFTICGEGECLKTLYTIYTPGDCRPGTVDLDEWEARGHKPPPPPKSGSAEIADALLGSESDS